MNNQELLLILQTSFSLKDLKMLSYKLNLEYEDIAGEDREDKALNLVKHFERRKRIKDVYDAGMLLRPDAFTTDQGGAVKLPLTQVPNKRPILFLAADPVNAARLRLGEELKKIQDTLALATQRDYFVLHPRMSVGPTD